jgi:pimeloyl-ACP methyl ester carboxylesterase
MPSFRSRGFEIYYETHGTGGVPIVWIVGIAATCQGWLVLQVPELSQERQNVVFDPRGAGRSGDPGGAFTTRDLAEDVRALLDELSIDRAHVIGSLLGGLVAQELAIGHPDRVQSLVLVGSYARADGKRRMLLQLWRRMAELGMPHEIWVGTRLCWTLSEQTLEQRELIDAMMLFHLDTEAPIDEKVIARQVDACLAHDTLERLATIRAPTLVVTGESDILTPPHLSRQLAQGIPDSELVLMAGAGHLAMAEVAPRFNRLIERFITAHD